MDIFVTQKSINLFFAQINALAPVPYVNECHATLIVLPNGHIESKSFPLHIISFLSNRISNEPSNRAKITFQNIELFLRSSVARVYRNMDSLNVGKCNLLADWNLTLKRGFAAETAAIKKSYFRQHTLSLRLYQPIAL